MFSLSGRTAVVTGGARGIGRGISVALASAGARVVVAGRDAAALSGVVDELASLGAEALGVPTDITDPAAVDNVVQAALTRFGRIDGWVNNAGGAGPRDAVGLLEMTEAQWDTVVDLNLKAAFFSCQAAARAMATDGLGGSIVNITSGSVRMPSPRMGHYGAAKGGLDNLTAAMATEWGPLGIRVNAVQPGVIDTDEKRGQRGADWLRAQAAITPLGILGTPRDIGAACVFLVSDEARWITGSAVVVDGGSRALADPSAAPPRPPTT